MQRKAHYWPRGLVRTSAQGLSMGGLLFHMKGPLGTPASPQVAATPERCIPRSVRLLPGVAPALGPGSRLLPGVVHPWNWGTASAEARGGLSAAGLCWGLGPGRELPGHWQVMSLPLRLSPLGPRRASPGRTRECALLDSGKYSGHLQIKARRARGGVGWGVIPRAVLLGSDREEGPLKSPRRRLWRERDAEEPCPPRGALLPTPCIRTRAPSSGIRLI